jgi:hypothetical protein
MGMQRVACPKPQLSGATITFIELKNLFQNAKIFLGIF